jgi:hypothetical protein
VALNTYPYFNAEVKERVELYLYSPSGLRGLFLGEIYKYVTAKILNKYNPKLKLNYHVIKGV